MSNQKYSLLFFFSPVIICRVMNAKNNKQKTRNSGRKQRAMKTQFYTIELFFSSTTFFQGTLTNIPYFFLSPVIICRIMNANSKQKTQTFKREAKSNGNPFLHCSTFILSLHFTYENSETY